MIENGVKVFPKLMFSLEIKSLILDCGGSIYSKKCKAVRSCVKDKDCNSGIPGPKNHSILIFTARHFVSKNKGVFSEGL